MGEVIDHPGKEKDAEDQAKGLANGADPGRSIEDMAESGDGIEEEQQQFLDFGEKLDLTLKGKRPSESKVKFRPIRRDIQGQLGDKGDDETYVFVVVGRIQKVELVSQRDDVGRVVSKTRVHTLDPVDVQRLPDDMAEDILTQLD